MSKKLVLLVAVLTIASLSFAQSRTQVPAGHQPSAFSSAVQPAEGVASVAPATLTCAASYSSGTGQNATTYCVTVNGNIPTLSRGGEEMINQGVVDEGYGICDTTGGVDKSYYDYGWTDSGNLLASSFNTPNPKTAVSTRITNDGLFQITNTITQVPAKPTAPGLVNIKMAIKNLTGITRGVYILRHVDIDANLSASNNDFDYTTNTVWGSYAPGVGYHGLEVVNTTYTGGFSHNAYSLNTYSGPFNVCNIFSVISTQPFHGDGSAASWYFVNIPHNATKIVTLTYQPI